MTLKPSVEFRVQSFGGDGSRILHPHGQSFLKKKEYAQNWQERDCIRMYGLIKGSHIWNLAWKNRDIVQQHSFWEIRDGNLGRFSEDNWQQEPNLFREEITELKNDSDNRGLCMVSDLWDQVRNNDKWRTWKDLAYR